MANSVLFDNIDPDLELDVPADYTLYGAQIVIKYILDTFQTFVARSDWSPKPVAILELAINLKERYRYNERICTVESLIHGLLERMIMSDYLFFGENFDVFAPFAYAAVSLLDSADGTGQSSRANEMLKALTDADCKRTGLKNLQIEELYAVLDRLDLYYEHTVLVHVPDTTKWEQEEQVVISLASFASISNWNHLGIDRLIKDTTQAMKMDATLPKQ